VVSKPIYWDSCTYLDFLKGDHALHAMMLALMQDWQEGKVSLVTSALTIAEVLWVKCEDGAARSMIPKAKEKEIRSLFDPQPPADLLVVEVSRLTAEHARDLVWQHGIKPKDSIHVASALEAKCDVFHSNDKPLCKFSGRIGGNPILRIEPPKGERQETMSQILDEADAKKRRA
jgi:predicted nucleic acid-binding protein